MDVLEAPTAQSLWNDDAACAVEWGIDDVEVLLTVDYILIDHSFLDGLQVIPVHLAADNLNEVFVRFELHVLNLHGVHLVDNTFVVGSQYLCAVFPVSLVTVVLLRVVRGGDVYTGLCTKLTDGERNLRRWA